MHGRPVTEPIYVRLHMKRTVVAILVFMIAGFLIINPLIKLLIMWQTSPDFKDVVASAGPWPIKSMSTWMLVVSIALGAALVAGYLAWPGSRKAAT